MRTAALDLVKGEVCFRYTDARNARQLIADETIVILPRWAQHLQQVIGRTGHQESCDDFVEIADDFDAVEDEKLREVMFGVNRVCYGLHIARISYLNLNVSFRLATVQLITRNLRQ